MRKLRRNIKGSPKIYNMNMIDSSMIGQKRSMHQAKIDPVVQTVVQSELNLILF